MSSQEIQFDVVERLPFLFFVDKVIIEVPLAGNVHEYRETVRWFIRQTRAEACAQGLAEGTWSTNGPIVATFKEVEDA